MKRNIALLVAVVLVFALFAACGSKSGGSSSSGASTPPASSGGSSGKWPDYLNLGNGDAYYPIIKEGMGGDIVVTMAINQPSNGGDWKDLWIAKFYEKYMNINFKVEQILETALSERKNLMFASNDLPDMMINLGISANEIMKYGVADGQLMDLKPYFDPDLMPDFMYWYNLRPDVKGAITAPNGKVYSLCNIGDSKDDAAGVRIFTDQRWLEACGLQNPKTLNEFLDMLRVYKEKDVNGVGADNVVPLAASSSYASIDYYILNALGYLTRGRGYDPALRNDEAELPATNAELFKEYINVMKTMLNEKLLFQNYFTAPSDGTELNAVVLDNRSGVYANVIYTIGYDDWSEWIGLHPLTSDWNDKPQWPTQNATNVGNFVLSATNKYPELCMRFENTYFGDDARFLWVGPRHGSEEAMGVAGIVWNEETKTEDFYEAGWPEGVNDLWTYLMVVQGPMPGHGAPDLLKNAIGYREKWLGAPPQSDEKTFNLTNPDQHYRWTLYENSVPYFTKNFPGVYYISEDTIIKIEDLNAALKPYIDEQVALFITGRRSLDEFDTFSAELKSMGIDELQDIYKEIWANYQKAN